jgi:hypothetical protein
MGGEGGRGRKEKGGGRRGGRREKGEGGMRQDQFSPFPLGTSQKTLQASTNTCPTIPGNFFGVGDSAGRKGGAPMLVGLIQEGGEARATWVEAAGAEEIGKGVAGGGTGGGMAGGGAGVAGAGACGGLMVSEEWTFDANEFFGTGFGDPEQFLNW